MKTVTPKLIDKNGKLVKIINEDEYRKRLINESKLKGCEIELLQIFNRYDKMLQGCTNKQEAEAIGIMGVMEISALLDNKNVGKNGSLIANGKVIISG